MALYKKSKVKDSDNEHEYRVVGSLYSKEKKTPKKINKKRSIPMNKREKLSRRYSV